MDDNAVPGMNGLLKINPVPDDKCGQGNIEFLGNGGKIISLPDNVDPLISA